MMDTVIIVMMLFAALLVIASYFDRQNTLKHDKEHDARVKRALTLPKYRMKVTTSLGEIHYSDFFNVRHNPGNYSWVMTSKDCANSAAESAIEHGTKVNGRYLPACSIHDIQVESDEVLNEN